MITKDTTLCISIAERPSNFGTILFNASFEAKGLDYVYKAFGLKDDGSSLRDAVRGIRALGIRGCGVSMPFKVQAVELVDGLDDAAVKIGAINTIVNTRGKLRGYNTDYFGARAVLEKVAGLRKRQVLMVGAGGVAMAISAALVQLGVANVTVVNHDERQARRLSRKWGFAVARWGSQDRVKADVFINATPLGMIPCEDRLPLREAAIGNYDVIMDVVLSPLETKLVKLAHRRGRCVVPGYEMSLHQAAKQFELYTGRQAPMSVMKKQILALKH